MVTKKLVHKKKPKRLTTAKKMRLTKKVKKCKKKMEKQYKKNKQLGTIPIRRRSKKDVIPNSVPFKASYIAQLAQEQLKKKEENQKKALENMNKNQKGKEEEEIN